MTPDEQELMIFTIVNQIEDLFDENSEDHRFEWNKVDATQFFTSYIKAGAYLFNKVTGGEGNNLEFTHLANQLIVQDLLDNA